MYSNTQSALCNYALVKLTATGINFSLIPKEDLLMTCGNYNGIISDRNFRGVVDAINNIYEIVQRRTDN